MPLKERKKRGVVRNCSKNYITNCIIIQLLVYRNTILLKKKKNTHTFINRRQGEYFWACQPAKLCNYFFFFLVMADTLAFFAGGGGIEGGKT